jgi:predicted RNase H-like HicB family nuclease
VITEAVEFHLEGLKDDGISIPPPHSYSRVVEIRA